MNLEKITHPNNRILLIETNADEIKVIGNILRNSAYEVLVSTTRSQAQKIALSKNPDLILLGMQSQLIGLEFFKILREQEALSETPVVFIFPGLKDEIFDTLKEYENVDFVSKPFLEAELLFRVTRLMRLVQLKKKSLLAGKIVEDLVLTINSLELQVQNSGDSYMDQQNSAISELPSLIKKLSDLQNEFSESQAGISDHVSQHNSIAVKNNSPILLIEDNELNQAYIGSLLEEEGFRVIIAETGKKALREIELQKIDLILLDINMPDMSGAEISAELDELGNTAPVIIVSGYSENEIRKKYPSLVYDDYVYKPVSAEDLKSAIGRNSSSGENLNNISLHEYDYSLALSMAKNSNALLEKWMLEFVGLLEDAVVEFELLKKDEIKVINSKLRHGLLNYSVYFGAVNLKKLIWHLIDLNNTASTANTKPTLFKIKREVISLLKFYQKVVEQLKT